MSKEMKVQHQIGETDIFFCVKNAAGQVAVVTAGVWQSWTNWNNANIATYATDADDDGGGDFSANFPTSTPGSLIPYSVIAYQGVKDATADSLGSEELIWNGVAEVLDIEVALLTTVASIPSADITIELSNGASFDDAYKDAVVSITDISAGITIPRRISGYTGSTKHLTVERDFGFSIAAGDIVTIWASASEGTLGTVGQNAVRDAVWNAVDRDYVAQGTKGQRLHHAGRARY